MRSARLTFHFLLLSLFCLSAAPAQNRQMMRFNADESVLMTEIGAVITVQEGKLVAQVLPIPGRPAGDVEDGDEVGMANGKRVKTIAELREAYDAAKEGEEFKLGVRRDGRAQIVTFKRKADGNMPGGGGRMIVREGSGGDDEDVFPALGFGISTNDGMTSVNVMLPNAPKEVAEGDEVVSINGKDVRTSADFSKELDATKIGDDLSMTFRHEEKEYTVKMKRPEPPRGMMRMERK